MTLQEAIQVLEKFKEWQEKGDKLNIMLFFEEINEALEIAIDKLKDINK